MIVDKESYFIFLIIYIGYFVFIASKILPLMDVHSFYLFILIPIAIFKFILFFKKVMWLSQDQLTRERKQLEKIFLSKSAMTT